MVTIDSLKSGEDRVAIIGLGYVGLPLAVQLSMHFDVVGYDLKSERVQELRSGIDRTLEVDTRELNSVQIEYTDDPAVLKSCRLMIIAVPTPIDAYRIPDLGPLKSAAQIAGRQLTPGSCVVFESTVYPGATEEVCVPILERHSGLSLSKDFSVGYSPERINPGDKVHRLENIIKIVSGSDDQTLDFLAAVYGQVVKAGIHRASSIRVAEAAKVIENTQRDLNIALMNELSMIFDRIGIDTAEVLEAAGTKWNFLPFRPGLVGGHCIGVDPYYLTFKAESLGYHPEMILAGRRINDTMGKFVVERTIKMLIAHDKKVQRARVAVLGITFKENVPDLRNTKVVDIINELLDYGIDVRTHDPLADAQEAKSYYGITLSDLDELKDMDAVIIAVNHTLYHDMGLEQLADMCLDGAPLVIDIKGLFDPSEAARHNIAYWRL